MDDSTLSRSRRCARPPKHSTHHWTIRLAWNGEGLDRLLDQAHAGLVEQVVQRLRAEGWVTDVEVSFAIRGERGSIDVLGFHEASGIVLDTEVKAVVPDSQATLAGVGAARAGDRTVARMDLSRGRAPVGHRRILYIAPADRRPRCDVPNRVPAEWRRCPPMAAAARRADRWPSVPPIFASRHTRKSTTGMQRSRAQGPEGPIRAWGGRMCGKRASCRAYGGDGDRSARRTGGPGKYGNGTTA